MLPEIDSKHWLVSKDPDDFIWLTFDRYESSANTLSQEVLSELDQILGTLRTKIKPKGVVINSAKKSGFIAGADIKQFTDLQTAEEATNLIMQGQEVFNNLAALPFPTIALIKGFCLGGGLELALACDYRIAIQDPKTKIGLPEILLGIQPGWGGTVRLPRLIGSLTALDLILTGRTVDSRKAAKLGIVDCSIEERYSYDAIKHYINNLPTKRNCGLSEKVLQIGIVRSVVGMFLEKNINKKAKEKHYPAPYAIVRNWVENSIYSVEAMQAEAVSIGKLMVTQTAKNLLRVFFLRDKLKSFAKNKEYQPQHVHVIGAGTMGGDIAAWCAVMGFRVTLQDTNNQAISAALQRASKTFAKKLKLPHLVQAARDRLSPDVNGTGVTQADVIIEAIIENIDAKQKLFAELENKTKSTAILATNTSTITLDKISSTMKDPSRLVGIHFFNPVAKMELVEVVADSITDQDVLSKAYSFVGRLAKLPLPVKSAPGFLINRILLPYMLESVIIYEEGVSPELIDLAATDFGMVMGPIELADIVGIDICIAAAKGIGIDPPKILEDMVKAGKLGRKSGQGFYKHSAGKTKKSVHSATRIPSDVAERLILRLLNESIACLRNGIVSEEDFVDAGMIFGTGFAPFRGGPIQYINDQSRDLVKERLEKLITRYGDRFNLDPGWKA